MALNKKREEGLNTVSDKQLRKHWNMILWIQRNYLLKKDCFFQGFEGPLVAL